MPGVTMPDKAASGRTGALFFGSLAILFALVAGIEVLSLSFGSLLGNGIFDGRRDGSPPGTGARIAGFITGTLLCAASCKALEWLRKRTGEQPPLYYLVPPFGFAWLAAAMGHAGGSAADESAGWAALAIGALSLALGVFWCAVLLRRKDLPETFRGTRTSSAEYVLFWPQAEAADGRGRAAGSPLAKYEWGHYGAALAGALFGVLLYVWMTRA